MKAIQRECPAVFGRGSALNTVREHDAVVLQSLHLKQFEVDLAFDLGKQRDTSAENYRMNVEDNFINQIGVEEVTRQLLAPR